MKQHLFTLIALCFFFHSCTKEPMPAAPGVESGLKNTKGTHALRLNVSGFKRSFEELQSTTVGEINLKDQITNLYYIVYNIDGDEIKRVKYRSKDAGFGTILDTLDNGVYDVVLVGVRGDVLINGDRYWPQYATKLKFFDGAHFELFHTVEPEITGYDTFFAHTTVFVEDENVNQSVFLQRAVGALQINIEDAIPKKAARLEVDLTGEMYIFNFDSERPADPSLEEHVYKTFSSSDKGKTNYKVNLYVLNTISPMLVTLRAYDSNGQVIAQRTISKVQCAKNKKLVLSGKLFKDGPVTSGEAVYVNSNWDNNLKTVHF